MTMHEYVRLVQEARDDAERLQRTVYLVWRDREMTLTTDSWLGDYLVFEARPKPLPYPGTHV